VVFLQGEAFNQGPASLVSIDGGVLKVPLQSKPIRVRSPILAGVLVDRFFSSRTLYGRFKLDRLASVICDHNDSGMWIDLVDRDGYSQLRLLFPPRIGFDDKEKAVLAALRDKVIKKRLEVDLATRRALGISD
jgi:hypothetical protein